MKKNLLLILLLQLPLFTACNSTTQSAPANDAHQEASRRSADNVICHNCRASFKLSMAQKKQKGKESYIECPICHHNYLKKAH